MISYIIWDVAPEIFKGITFFRWYGLCWVVGILLAQRIMLGIYRREEVPLSEVDTLSLYMILGVLIGARLGHVLFYEPVHYLNHPIEILPIKTDPEFQFTGLAGLASHGGILGGLLGLYLYNRKFKRGYLWLLDRLMIAGTALGALIRLGNLMNSEIIGVPADVPWAFVFTRVDPIPRHPSQLYEAVFYAVVSVALYSLWKSERYKYTRGFVFGLGMALIFIQRFLIEFLKENQVSFEEDLILNIGQVLSIPLIVGSIGLMVWSRRQTFRA